MKIKKYTNGAWTDLDTPVKKFDEYTDEATTLPLTIETSKTNAVENYQVYGTSAGAGVQTENVYDLKLWEQAHPTYCQTVGDTVYITGVDASMISGAINVDVPSGYYFTVTPMAAQNGTTARQGKLRLIDENGTAHIYYITNVNNAPLPQISEQLSFAVKKIGVDYNAMNNGFGVKQMMFTPTAPTSYIPYGYKIPISNTSGEQQSNYDLFIGSSKLGEEEYVDFVKQKIYRTILLTTHDNKDFITSDNKRFCVRRSNNG